MGWLEILGGSSYDGSNGKGLEFELLMAFLYLAIEVPTWPAELHNKTFRSAAGIRLSQA
jgi:hypothetical protein